MVMEGYFLENPNLLCLVPGYTICHTMSGLAGLGLLVQSPVCEACLCAGLMVGLPACLPGLPLGCLGCLGPTSLAGLPGLAGSTSVRTGCGSRRVFIGMCLLIDVLTYVLIDVPTYLPTFLHTCLHTYWAQPAWLGCLGCLDPIQGRWTWMGTWVHQWICYVFAYVLL